MTLNEHLTAVADAIREKTGETDAIAAVDFPEKILSIETESSSPLTVRRGYSTLAPGNGTRSVTFRLTTLSSIYAVAIYGLAPAYSSGPSTLLSATYINGTTDCTTGTLTVSGNSITYTVSQSYGAVYFTAFAVGEPA